MGVGRKLLGAALFGGAMLAFNRILRNFNILDLNKKVIIITGGSRGLGLVLARQLNESGAKVVICARNEDDLKKATTHLSGNDYLAVPCDLTNRADVENLIQQVITRYSRIDGLINNAGTIQTGPLNTMAEKDFEEAFKIHFWAPYYMINEVLPHMQGRGGNIVNIASIGGKISVPHLIPYSTSKFALSGYSEGLTAELRDKKIKVTTVYPGLMRTGSPRNVLVKGQYKKEYALFKIMDSLPILSVDAERAATKIIKAMRTGEKTLIITLPAKLAVAFHGINPSFNIGLFKSTNTLLPDSEEGRKVAKKGYESKSKASETFLTGKTDKAAKKNNEFNNP